MVGAWLAPCFVLSSLSFPLLGLLFLVGLGGRMEEGAHGSCLRMLFHPWLAMSSEWLLSNDNAFIAQ